MLEEDSHNGVFFGELENGERSGEGDETLPDSSRYKGRYCHGKRDGHGVLLDPDGREVYRGEWRDDLKHGRGSLRTHRPEGSSWGEATMAASSRTVLREREVHIYQWHEHQGAVARR